MSLCNDGSIVPSCTSNDSAVDVSLVPLGTKATHDTTAFQQAMGEVEVPRGNEDKEVSE